MCRVRNPRWHLVSEKGGAEPQGELFDLQSDYREKTDVAEQHPAVVKELASAFDRFWNEALPLMVNEEAVSPSIKPFQELYYK